MWQETYILFFCCLFSLDYFVTMLKSSRKEDREKERISRILKNARAQEKKAWNIGTE